MSPEGNPLTSPIFLFFTQRPVSMFLVSRGPFVSVFVFVSGRVVFMGHVCICLHLFPPFRVRDVDVASIRFALFSRSLAHITHHSLFLDTPWIPPSRAVERSYASADYTLTSTLVLFQEKEKKGNENETNDTTPDATRTKASRGHFKTVHASDAFGGRSCLV